MNLALLLNPEPRQETTPSFGMPLSSGFYPNQQLQQQQQQYHEDLHSQEADERMSQELNFDPRLSVDYLLNERGSIALPPPPTSPPSSPGSDTYTTTTTTTTTTTFLAIQAPPGSLPFSPCSTTSKCPTSPTNLPVSSPQQQTTTQRPRKRGFESNADGPATTRNKSNIGAKPKKTRRRLKSDELFMLESVFTQNNTPDTFTKLKLSQALHMSPQQVSNW